MILVPVSDEDATDLSCMQIGKIRNNQINAGQVVIRECGAAICNNNILLCLKDGHIFPDFAQTAQRNNLERWTADAVRLFAAAGTAIGLRGRHR